jgi:hypothetical protein
MKLVFRLVMIILTFIIAMDLDAIRGDIAQMNKILHGDHRP